MLTEHFRIETPEQFAQGIRKAAELLTRGELVAVPTETVYGLAANALNEAAVLKIYQAKGRPAHNPIIVHVDSISMARDCTRSWPNVAGTLAAAFWPGPLTLVLPRAEAIPGIVTAGGDTVAVRCPAHPFMRELIRECRFPLAAPSANLSNELSPTTAAHVLRMLDGKIPLIIDAGPASVGIESTVVDLSVSPPRVLRAGMISTRQVSNVIGTDVREVGGGEPVLKSPGLLKRHYAPRARMQVLAWQDESELNRVADSLGVTPRKVHVVAHERIPQSNAFGRVAIIPQDPEAYARALYAELHLSDELGAELILVEAVPSGPEWQGIRDRLSRAAAAG